MSIENEPTISAIHGMLSEGEKPGSMKYRYALGDWVVAIDADAPPIVTLEELTTNTSLTLDRTSIYIDGQLVQDPEIIERLVIQITKNFGLPRATIDEN